MPAAAAATVHSCIRSIVDDATSQCRSSIRQQTSPRVHSMSYHTLLSTPAVQTSYVLMGGWSDHAIAQKTARNHRSSAQHDLSSLQCLIVCKNCRIARSTLCPVRSTLATSPDEATEAVCKPFNISYDTVQKQKLYVVLR